jgi:hypothetical protein
MAPLRDMMPPSNRVLYVFYDFETTQNKRYPEKATVHAPNLVCVQQFCSRRESIAEVEQDCEQCDRRQHSFREDPVGDFMSYLCEPRPWDDRIVVIAHKAKDFDLQFILNRTILLKWRPELIMNGMTILSMKMEHLTFLDSVSFIPCPLRKLPEAFGLSSSKSWYPHYFNTEENLDYVGSMPDVSYYGLDEMSDSERKNFLAWYEGQKRSSSEV